MAENVGKLIDKNLNSEMAVYKKYGEMKLGSSLTDLTAFLSTVGVGSWLISRADTPEGHIESGFRQGVPIACALSSLVYCSINMIPKIWSLGISAVVGLIAKKAGDKVADVYVSTNEQKKEYQKLKAKQAVAINKIY